MSDQNEEPNEGAQPASKTKSGSEKQVYSPDPERLKALGEKLMFEEIALVREERLRRSKQQFEYIRLNLINVGLLSLFGIFGFVGLDFFDSLQPTQQAVQSVIESAAQPPITAPITPDSQPTVLPTPQPETTAVPLSAPLDAPALEGNINRESLSRLLFALMVVLTLISTTLFLFWVDDAITIAGYDRFFKDKERYVDRYGDVYWYEFREHLNNTASFKAKKHVFNLAIFMAFLLPPFLFVMFNMMFKMLDISLTIQLLGMAICGIFLGVPIYLWRKSTKRLYG